MKIIEVTGNGADRYGHWTLSSFFPLAKLNVSCINIVVDDAQYLTFMFNGVFNATDFSRLKNTLRYFTDTKQYDIKWIRNDRGIGFSCYSFVIFD